MDRGPLGSGGHDDEVAEPGRKLFEGVEQLLPFGAALCPPQPLVGLALRQIEALQVLLRLLACLLAALRVPSSRRSAASAGSNSGSR